ncbi:MAG: NusG domain II-containing protein [Christensenellales bacterium]|jgi:hypothetical protein
MVERRKISTRFLIIFFAALFAAAMAATLFRFPGGGGAFAHVSLDGEIFAVIDLSEAEEAYLLEVSPGNILLVEKGAISMHSADCPDQLCVRQGKTGEGGLPIICLPNRIMVEIKPARGEGEKVVDAVSGR